MSKKSSKTSYNSYRPRPYNVKKQSKPVTGKVWGQNYYTKRSGLSFEDFLKRENPEGEQGSCLLYNNTHQCKECKELNRLEYEKNSSYTKAVKYFCQDCRYGNIKIRKSIYAIFYSDENEDEEDDDDIVEEDADEKLEKNDNEENSASSKTNPSEKK